MLAATQQQLILVTNKAKQLESDVQREIQTLRELKTRKEECEKTVMDLRERLLREERRYSEVKVAHDQSEESLRKYAKEYQRAQLLQKRFSNTLNDLCGHNRCVVSVMSPFSPTSSQGISDKVIKVPDECTVILPTLKKTFIVDSAAIASDRTQQHQMLMSSNVSHYQQQNLIPSVVEDSLKGYNYSLFSLSAVTSAPSTSLSSSWTTVMFGSLNDSISSPNQFNEPLNPTTSNTSIIDAYSVYFFDNLENLGVTHFNMRCTFVELTMSEGNVDLLAPQGRHTTDPVMLPVGLGTVAAVLSPSTHQGATSRNAVSAEASSLPIRSLMEMRDIVTNGLVVRNNRLRAKYDHIAHSQHIQMPPPTPEVLACMYGGHLVLTLFLENFDCRGHFRKSTVIFTETTPILLESENIMNTQEQSWGRKCTGALTDVLSMASAASIAKQQQHNDLNGQDRSVATLSESIATTLSTLELPHQKNRLVQLLQPCFGGNCKSLLYCTIPSTEADGTTLANSSLPSIANILAYAHYFKNTCHRAVPYDLPPELQMLTKELNIQSSQQTPDQLLYNQHNDYNPQYIEDYDDVISATGMTVGPPSDIGQSTVSYVPRQSYDTLGRDNFGHRTTVESVAERERREHRTSDIDGRWNDEESAVDGRYYLQ